MNNINTVEDAFKAGAVLAAGLLLLFYLQMMFSANSMSEAVDLFAHTTVVLVFAFVPTTEIGAVISVFAGAIGGVISLDKIGPKPIAVIFTTGFFYTAVNIIINWFTISV